MSTIKRLRGLQNRRSHSRGLTPIQRKNDGASKLSGATRTLTAGAIVLTLCVLTAAAQTPQTQDEKLEAANAAFKEGFEAFQKGTSDSLCTAASKLETASELFKQAGDKRWQSAALLGFGRVLNDLGEKASAIERYKEALPLLRELKEKTGEIAALNNIAAAYLTRSSPFSTAPLRRVSRPSGAKAQWP